MSRQHYLILTPRILFPADTGGKIRSSRLFEKMMNVCETTIITYRSQKDTDETVAQMERICDHLELIEWHEPENFSPSFYAYLASNLVSPYPYNVEKYHTAGMERRIKELLLKNHYDAIICDFLQAGLNMINLDYQPKILFEHNVEAVIRRRQFEKAKNPAAKIYFYWDWLRTHRFERLAGEMFDHSIMVSDKDCQTMATNYGVFNTSPIPLGVDVDYFETKLGPDGEGNHLVFTGSMDWLPNQDGMKWMVEEVMPLIRKEIDVTFWAVGRNPTPDVVKYGEDNADVEVTGTVDDIRPYVDRCAVYVVPLRIGGGTRIKIFEAMAMTKATVSTTIGAEGLPVTHGKDIILSDTPASFAADCVRLLKDAAERRRIGEAARKLMVERYTWDVAGREFADICAKVARRHNRESIA